MAVEIAQGINTIRLTRHAAERLLERSSLSETGLIQILQAGEITIPLGVGKKKHHQHILLYWKTDKTHLVAVLDIKTNEVITVLWPDYHNLWQVPPDALNQARKLGEDLEPENKSGPKPATDTKHTEAHRLIFALKGPKGINRVGTEIQLKIPANSAEEILTIPGIREHIQKKLEQREIRTLTLEGIEIENKTTKTVIQLPTAGFKITPLHRLKIFMIGHTQAHKHKIDGNSQVLTDEVPNTEEEALAIPRLKEKIRQKWDKIILKGWEPEAIFLYHNEQKILELPADINSYQT